MKIIVAVVMLRNEGKIAGKDTIDCHKTPVSSADNIHLGVVISADPLCIVYEYE